MVYCNMIEMWHANYKQYWLPKPSSGLLLRCRDPLKGSYMAPLKGLGLIFRFRVYKNCMVVSVSWWLAVKEFNSNYHSRDM